MRGRGSVVGRVERSMKGSLQEGLVVGSVSFFFHCLVLMLCFPEFFSASLLLIHCPALQLRVGSPCL